MCSCSNTIQRAADFSPRGAARAEARGSSVYPLAFTLLELIIVMTIIIILATLIVPRMGGSLGRRELHEAAGKFAHTVRTVRELAIAKGQPYALEIDLDRGGYCVTTPAGSDQPGRWQHVQASWLKAQRWPKSVTVASYRTPDGTTAAVGTQYLKFFPDGTSSGAALRLAGQNAACNVVVHPHSGRVDYGDLETATFGVDQYDLGD